MERTQCIVCKERAINEEIVNTKDGPMCLDCYIPLVKKTYRKDRRKADELLDALKHMGGD